MNSRTKANFKTLLIIGGAGYIGSYVNKRLQQEGYETVVFDNLSRGHRSNVIRGSFIQGDLADLSILESVFKQHSFAGILHFGAFTDVGESVKNPYIYYQNNVVNTLNLLHLAVNYEIKSFVFSSSAAIFGIPVKNLIDENHPCAPINPYGRTKWLIEMILQDFDRAYGLKSCCLRYFNAAGADPEGEIKWHPRKETNLIPLLLRSLQEPKQEVTLYGSDYPTQDGTCIRDYIHLYDLAEAHIKGLEQLFESSTSTAYNLGNGQGFSVKEVIDAVERVTGLPLQIAKGSRRPGDPPILVANAMKAKEELEWKPRYPDLDTMIAHAYKVMV
ncbi:MAG: UDP-glucose 4-epimerase GalE [Parachlamydiaceae bacterium]|nr:UDP-glucose 4-epimerase GalE [Parachlamydiaceae bacterium]